MKNIKSENSIEIEDVFILNEKYFSIAGIWPLKSGYLKFTIYMIYCWIMLALLWIDLYKIFGDLEVMVENLVQSLVLFVVIVMAIVIRFNNLLPRLIVNAKNDIVDVDRFENEEEQWLYATYNRTSKIFTTVAFLGSVCVASSLGVLYMKQVFSTNSNKEGNETRYFKLPFRTYVPPITNYRIFIVGYLIQMPCIYAGVSHTVVTTLLVNLTLHLCGELSILSSRIRNLGTHPKEQLRTMIQRHVKKHLKLIE